MKEDKPLQVLFEDNHLIIINKRPGDIVQGDKTGDNPLMDMVKDYLLEIRFHTGRNHQIHVQLSTIGSFIKGDIKYGFDRANEDGSIHLHSRRVEFLHPSKKELMIVVAPVPDDKLWKYFEGVLEQNAV